MSPILGPGFICSNFIISFPFIFKSFIEKEGIKESQIINISQVDINNLPDEIEIKKMTKSKKESLIKRFNN